MASVLAVVMSSSAVGGGGPFAARRCSGQAVAAIPSLGAACGFADAVIKWRFCDRQAAAVSRLRILTRNAYQVPHPFGVSRP
jgi:hypothetical protein